MAAKVNIIGAGAAGLFLAVLLAEKGIKSTIYDANTAAGRKFLVAGGGGLNLTHSEDAHHFIQRYTPSEFMAPAFAVVDNKAFMVWLEKLGIDLFIGSSGRVFPEKKYKPIELLSLLIRKAEEGGAEFKFKHALESVSKNGCVLKSPEGLVKVEGTIVYALGGASWQVTGSTGKWLSIFRDAGCETEDFAASNCQFLVNWPTAFIQAHEGKPIKNAAFSCGNRSTLGEVIVTKAGIEGSGVYPLSPIIRQQLATGEAIIELDFFPQLSVDKVLNKIKGQDALSKQLLQLITRTQLALLKAVVSKDDFEKPAVVAQYLKHLPLRITGTGAIDDAISVAGGLALSEIDAHFKMKRFDKAYAIGEMLAYDAPTGGYLLQSCFTMAAVAVINIAV